MRKRTKANYYNKEKAMDYTGKSVGKRYLDENGNFMPISSLPESVQKEIAENSREAGKMFMESRMSRSGVNVKKGNDGEVNDKLLSIIEAQTAMIQRLEARLEDIDVAVEPEVKLTPKEALLAEAMDLGLVVNEKMTMKQIQELIDEETMEVVPADSEEYADTDDNDL